MKFQDKQPLYIITGINSPTLNARKIKKLSPYLPNWEYLYWYIADQMRTNENPNEAIKPLVLTLEADEFDKVMKQIKTKLPTYPLDEICLAISTSMPAIICKIVKKNE